MKKLLPGLLVVCALLVLSFPCQASSALGFTDTRVQTTATITVATSATTTAEIDLGGTELVGLQMPATFTGTAITFLVANASGGTFQGMVDGAGGAVSKTVAQGKYVGIDPTLFRGVRFVKLVSGSSEGADRSITVFSIPAH